MVDFLYHHGIKGQKWGVRRFQNYDGTLTPEGRARYYGKRVFVSGSSHTTDPTSPHYMPALPKSITDEIDRYIAGKSSFNIGEAPGIDRQVQDYLKSKNYKNVVVYSPDKEPRYIADTSWKVRPVLVKGAEKMSKEWLAGKDVMMTKMSDVGLAIPHDNPDSATYKNVKRLLAQNKHVTVFELSNKDGNLVIKKG